MSTSKPKRLRLCALCRRPLRSAWAAVGVGPVCYADNKEMLLAQGIKPAARPTRTARPARHSSTRRQRTAEPDLLTELADLAAPAGGPA